MHCHHSSNSSSNGSSSLSNSPFPNEGSFLHHSNSTPPPHNHHQCVATVKCQDSYTSSLFLHGKFLITGSSDKEIHIWEHSSLSSITKLLEGAAGKGAVKALLVTSDHKIISAHQDHKIRIWKINFVDENHHKFTHLATLPTLSDRAVRVLVPKNHVRIRRHKKSTWVHHVDAVSALALSKDESLLYSVSWDKTLKIWRTKDFKCMESVANAHEDAINAIALSGDGFVYTASSDRQIKAWKKYPGDKKHSLVAALEKHDSGVNALALTEDGLVLFSGGSDRIILVWTNAGGVMVAVAALRGHGEAVLCLTLVSDFVFSGSADKTVRIWKWAAGKSCCLAILDGHQGPVKCVTAAFEKISRAHLLYSASLDCYIKAWQVFLPLD